jgi:hypothetical protein
MSILASHAFAAPSISGASGQVKNGGQITISGSSFGTKSPAAPILWDQFNSGTAGQNLSSSPKWEAYKGSGPQYSATQPYGGSGLSAHNVARYSEGESSGFETAVSYFNGTDELYYSFMSRYTGPGDGGRVYKNGRMNTGTNRYSGDGMLAISDNYIFYRPGSSSIYPDGRHFNSTNIASGNWQRHQMYGKLSSPSGSSNGKIWVQIASESKTYSNIVTRGSGYSFKYGTIILGLMMANMNSGDVHYMYVDDVYVDKTLARVELCDASTWSNRKACDLQIPSAWSGTSITATVNQGAFANNSKAYLYVVDAAGNANSQGYPVTLGTPIAGGAPSVPQNFVIK